MKDSIVFLFPWKQILHVAWGQTSICGHVPKRHCKSFGDLQSKQHNQISLTITGHTAANRHSQLVVGKLSHTTHVHLHTAPCFLGPRILLLHIFHSYILLPNSFFLNCSCLPFSQGLKTRQASLWLEQVNKATSQSKVYTQPRSGNYNEI